MAATKHLTKVEKVWLKELQKVLDNQPTGRLSFATTGDCFFYLFDNDRRLEIGRLVDSGNLDWMPAASEIKADFDGFYIKFKNPVESASG